MSEQIAIHVYPEQVADLVIELSQLDGIEVEIQETRASWDAAFSSSNDPNEKPLYSLNIPELVTVIVSITGLITSFAGLAKIILDSKEVMKKAKSGDSEGLQKQLPPITVNVTINLSSFSKGDELAAFIEADLKKKAHIDDMLKEIKSKRRNKQ